jgi:hypothetical protein
MRYTSGHDATIIYNPNVDNFIYQSDNVKITVTFLCEELIRVWCRNRTLEEHYVKPQSDSQELRLCCVFWLLLCHL